MEQELKDQGRFKDFYQFTFNFAKNPGQKGLGNATATHQMMCCNPLFVISILYPPHPPPPPFALFF